MQHEALLCVLHESMPFCSCVGYSWNSYYCKLKMKEQSSPRKKERFKRTCCTSSQLPPQSLINCLHDIKAWMSSNYLKLNSKKTELMVVAPKALLQKVGDFILEVDGYYYYYYY